MEEDVEVRDSWEDYEDEDSEEFVEESAESNPSEEVVLTPEQEEMVKHLKIRKLTPEECFILMSATAEDCQKCKDAGVSNSQLYKQAGNELISNCVQYLVEHLYKVVYDPNFETTDERMVREGYGVEK